MSLQISAPGRLRWAAALLILLLVGIGGSPLAAEGPDEERVEKLEQALEEIRAELERLKEETRNKEEAAAEAAAEAIEAPRTPSDFEERFSELERKIDVLAGELERKEMGEGVFRPAEKSEYGLGVAASKVYQVDQGVSIGGYGEMVYEAVDSTRDDGTPSGQTDEIDFLRAILYFGYKFNDRFVFNSEIEVEHAATGEEGSVSLEFAYIDYLWKPQLNVRTGILLVPMGFTNELHEPPLFLGVRRPDVERSIIPTTWRENGFGIFGDVGPFSYRTYILNGLEGAEFSSGGLRGGRQKGSKALAEDFAWVGRLDYTGRPGLLAGVSAYVGDSGQGIRDATGTIDVNTTILEAHLEWKYRGFELRALGVQADLDDVARLNNSLGLAGSSSIGEELEGWYLQLGYDVLASRVGRSSFIPYVRWEEIDTQKAVPAGFLKNPAREVDLLTVGVAFKPIDQLVFKFDFQDYDNEAGTGVDQFNIGIGYLF